MSDSATIVSKLSQLPPGWIRSPLSAVANVRLGRQRSPKNHSGPNMRPYLRAANVTWSGLALNDVKEMNFSEAEVETYRLRAGDILLSEASGSADEVGKPARWRDEIQDCCFQNTLIRVRSCYLDSRYLLWLFKWLALSGQFASGSRGVGIHHLGATTLSDWEVPIAPEAEQNRIVAAIEEQFSRLEAGVSALVRAQTNLTLMRAAAVESAVTGRLLDGETHDWPVRPLGEVLIDIQAGKSFKCTERPAVGDEWGVVKVSAMTWGEFREEEHKTILDTAKVDPRWEIRPGDLLVSRANTVDYVGAVVLVSKARPRLLLSDKSLRLIPSPDVMPEWLLVSLRSRGVRQYIERVATGTKDSMRNISQEKLRATLVPIPPLATQAELLAEVDRLSSLIDTQTTAVAHAFSSSQALRASILAAAFSGNLVAQMSSEESASVLLERIALERASAAMPSRTRKIRTPSRQKANP
jgi:type I restriction enzyme, S subunit